MIFSDRIGTTSPKSIIQLNDMDEDLRNRLWNIYLIHIGYPIRISKNVDEIHNAYLRILWNYYFKLPLDEMPYKNDKTIAEIRDHFFDCEWYEVYNLIEFTLEKAKFINKTLFIKQINEVLEDELSGYRIIKDKFIPLTDEIEIEEIEESLNNTYNRNIEGANIHLNSALILLSNRDNPDFRNSIKESISAVESLCLFITNESNDALGKTLSKLKEKIDIHGALERGFKSIYGYTSDAEGIRHALLEKDNLDLEDAIFMLVSCSAFINYIIVKADKAGLIK